MAIVRKVAGHFCEIHKKETFVRYHKDSDGHILFISRIDAIKDSGTSPSLS
jgi:hypothetical protein